MCHCPSDADLKQVEDYAFAAEEGDTIYVEPSQYCPGDWDAYTDRTSTNPPGGRSPAFLDPLPEEMLLVLRDGHEDLDTVRFKVVLRSTGEPW